MKAKNKQKPDSPRREIVIRLSPTEYIETAYAEYACGPGWANTPIWVLISDRATGKTRRVCLQPEEQTVEINTLYAFSAMAHNRMINAVHKLVRQGKP